MLFVIEGFWGVELVGRLKVTEVKGRRRASTEDQGQTGAMGDRVVVVVVVVVEEEEEDGGMGGLIGGRKSLRSFKYF